MDYLAIYLRDQLALGIAWRELAKRAAGNNPSADAARRVANEIAEDVETFRKIMERLGVKPNPAKNLAAAVAERLGRFKPNGHLKSYSPLSRFEELEFLTMGIDGKKQLWATLRDEAALRERLPDVDFDHLIQRAHAQRTVLEPLRAAAGKAALAR